MQLLWYKSARGDEPARSFIANLADPVGRTAFFRRLFQIESGNPGDQKSLGGGIWEFRLHSGPGYRLYAGRLGANAFLLLTAGRKATQRRDVAAARRFWKDFQEGQ